MDPLLIYCSPKKFLPACWHLSSVLLESEVWVRPAQLGALFLHNLRVCLTFWHVMYPKNNVALFLHNLRVCWLSWHGMFLQNNIALILTQLEVVLTFLACFRQYVGRGWLRRVMAFHGYRPFWVPGTTKKGPVFIPRRGVQVKLGPWLVRLGVLFFAFHIYTYVFFPFIEVGESKFIRVQWKRLFPCAVHVSLLSVRSHVSCLITVFWMFANQTLGEYSIRT
jgi:hypothetical protein